MSAHHAGIVLVLAVVVFAWVMQAWDDRRSR